MQKRKSRRVLFVFCLCLVFAGCEPITPDDENETILADSRKATATTNSSEASDLLGEITEIVIEYKAITPETISQIVEVGSIQPEQPSHYHVSGNSRIGAVGNQADIQIFEISGANPIMEIPQTLPNCPFGKSRYFKLNFDGSFIGISTPDKLQVWQVGGGLVFQQENNRFITPGSEICGADVPEIAISPEGKLIVVSGFEQREGSPVVFFRVIDILENAVIYEWDGSDELAHGTLYDFPGLGFSRDGDLLQSFDPKLYITHEGNLHYSFRFWDAADWTEVSRSSSKIRESFSPGDLLFGVSEENSVIVRDRVSGRRVEVLEDMKCQWAFPCSLRFSPDGSQAAIFTYLEGTDGYGGARVSNRIEIRDVETGEHLGYFDGSFRNLDGIFSPDGSLLDNFQKEPGLPAPWRTYQEYFAGIIHNSSRKIIFHPIQATCGAEEDCSNVRTCFFNDENPNIDCEDSFLSTEGHWISIHEEEDRYMLQEEVEGKPQIIGQIPFNNHQSDDVRLRLLGYSDPYQIAFFCLDINSRLDSCAAFDILDGGLLSEFGDISFLRFSKDEQYAAFYDRADRRLKIMDLESRRITIKTSYQARAYAINPVLTHEGEIMHIIQDLDDSDRFSVEYIDLESKKTLSRRQLKIKNISPTVFAADEEEKIWFIGDEDGYIHAFNPGDGEEIHSWQAGSNSIIGLILDEKANRIISMEQSSTIRFWARSIKQ